METEELLLKVLCAEAHAGLALGLAACIEVSSTQLCEAGGVPSLLPGTSALASTSRSFAH